MAAHLRVERPDDNLVAIMIYIRVIMYILVFCD